MVLEYSARKGGVVTARVNSLRRWAVAAAATVLLIVPVRASDHADPIDILRRMELEGGITDLFVFPDRGKLIVVLCVRRALTQTLKLNLEPYTYAIHMDLKNTVAYDNDQEVARYGGSVVKPENISPDVTISFRLRNDATFRDKPTMTGLNNAGPERIDIWTKGPDAPDRITVWSGVRDDPFIFPPFFGTNVVAMVLSLPMDVFPANQQDWIVWGTSSRGRKQVDHVGRSLRTQNPRFEILNTLEPKDHVAAIRRAEERPRLMADLFLRLGFQQTFAYRPWDKVPDVMIYTTRRPVGFPNGRLLTEDVAELLARYGDTLLKEISYIADAWPRATTNDKAFLPAFPYLAEPWPDKMPKPPYSLSTATRLKLFAIALAILVPTFLLGWWVAYRHYRRKLRLRYL